MGRGAGGWKATFVFGAAIFLFFSALLYLRRLDYNLFIVNKAVASAAVFLIGSSYVLGPLAHFWPKFWVPKLSARKYLGLLGFAIASLHMVLSLVMLSPAYYPKLFDASGKLTGAGEISLLSAAFAMVLFSVVAVTSLPDVERSMKRSSWEIVQRIGYIAFFLVAAHVYIIKWHGWFEESNWMNGLPPGSLIVFLFIVFVFVLRLLAAVTPERKKGAKR
ncbi:ferric reductase-like transmembrane domain-containing protein [Candidatus Woesearchaeota archaeon]|nr:ferric reductase-like transmembrane domain-containing protein [Candidatus Woesearchaeota archaeon]